MRIFHMIGRRGAFLLFLCVLDLLIGYSLLTDSASVTKSLHLIPSAGWWATVWIGVGIICAIGSAVKKDQIAYAAATGLKISWATSTLFTWIAYNIPRGWVGVVIWYAFAATTLLISSWPEEVPIVPVSSLSVEGEDNEP